MAARFTSEKDSKIMEKSDLLEQENSLDSEYSNNIYVMGKKVELQETTEPLIDVYQYSNEKLETKVIKCRSHIIRNMEMLIEEQIKRGIRSPDYSKREIKKTFNEFYQDEE